MLATGRRLGAHLPLGHGMVKAADRAVEIGAAGRPGVHRQPDRVAPPPTLPRELPAFRERLAAAGIAPLVVHAPYLVNLAGPDPDVFERSVAVLANELRVAAAWDAAIVNVHFGSHRGAGFEAGVRRLTDGLCRVLADVGTAAPGVTVVLENGTGGGSGIGSSVEELARSRRRSSPPASTAAGSRGASTSPTSGAPAMRWTSRPASTRSWPSSTAPIGLRRLRLVHVNDSRSERGSRIGSPRAPRRGPHRRTRASPGS